jgi:hypothetical protein
VNGSVNVPVTRQWLSSRHMIATTNTFLTIEELLEAVFSVPRGCYMRTITASVQLENKNSGRGSQGACRQDELIGGKPPVVK